MVPPVVRLNGGAAPSNDVNTTPEHAARYCSNQGEVLALKESGRAAPGLRTVGCGNNGVPTSLLSCRGGELWGGRTVGRKCNLIGRTARPPLGKRANAVQPRASTPVLGRGGSRFCSLPYAPLSTGPARRREGSRVVMGPRRAPRCRSMPLPPAGHDDPSPGGIPARHGDPCPKEAGAPQRSPVLASRSSQGGRVPLAPAPCRARRTSAW